MANLSEVSTCSRKFFPFVDVTSMQKRYSEKPPHNPPEIGKKRSFVNIYGGQYFPRRQNPDN